MNFYRHYYFSTKFIVKVNPSFFGWISLSGRLTESNAGSAARAFLKFNNISCDFASPLNTAGKPPAWRCNLSSVNPPEIIREPILSKRGDFCFSESWREETSETERLNSSIWLLKELISSVRFSFIEKDD